MVGAFRPTPFNAIMPVHRSSAAGLLLAYAEGSYSCYRRSV